MIVSHRHRLIFVAVPRTGSQSVRAALRPLLGPEDWEQAAWGTARRVPISSLAATEHGHLGVREAERHLPRKVWRDYFKFAVVRDPWDRFLSSAWFTQGKHPLFRARPGTCMGLLLRNPGLLNSLHFRPQHTFVETIDGSVGVDFVGRYEHLAEDFARVCDVVGTARQELPRLNASSRKRLPPDDARGLRAAVTHYYARDYELFRYELPGDTRRDAPERGDQPFQGHHHP
jgi:hypothetical protein